MGWCFFSPRKQKNAGLIHDPTTWASVKLFPHQPALQKYLVSSINTFLSLVLEDPFLPTTIDFGHFSILDSCLVASAGQTSSHLSSCQTKMSKKQLPSCHRDFLFGEICSTWFLKLAKTPLDESSTMLTYTKGCITKNGECPTCRTSLQLHGIAPAKEILSQNQVGGNGWMAYQPTKNVAKDGRGWILKGKQLVLTQTFLEMEMGKDGKKRARYCIIYERKVFLLERFYASCPHKKMLSMILMWPLFLMDETCLDLLHQTLFPLPSPKQLNQIHPNSTELPYLQCLQSKKLSIYTPVI